VNEISLILKNNLLISIEEFRILDRYASEGRLWTLIHRPTEIVPYFIRYKTIEYIFYPEDLTIFCIVSNNILATWETDITKLLRPGQEFQLADSLFIEPLTS
jgi:hypothetical protein